MITLLRRRRLHERGEQGSALVLALVFLVVGAFTVGGLLTYANTSSDATIALRSARGADYNAKGAMQAAIATVRTGTTCTAGGTSVYTTPAGNLNNPPGTVLRVDCFGQSSLSGERNDVLSVCPSSVAAPCPDSSSLLEANVIFYDTPSVGASIGVQTWSGS